MAENDYIMCPRCNGEGGHEHPTNQPNWYGEDMEWIKCEDCAGTGTVENINEEVDKYGNLEGELRFCCFPDCGCDGSRLCMAEEGPSFGAVQLNLEKSN